MAPSTDLFELIKSLTASEKRYFKMFAASVGGKEDSQYLKLFEAIDSQSEYNEKELREKYKGEAFLKYLSANKNYLYDSILKALQQFHQGSGFHSGAFYHLGTIELLFQKGLFGQCLKAISNYKPLMEQQENFGALLEILEWEARLHARNNDYGQVAYLMEKQLQILGSYQNAIKLKNTALQLYSLNQEASFGNAPIETGLLDATARPLLEAVGNKGLSLTERHHLLNGLYFYYTTKNEYGEALHFARQIFSLFMENPGFLQANARLFSSATQNLCFILLIIGKSNETTQVLHQLEKSLQLNDSSHLNEIHASALTTIINTEIVVEINSGNLDNRKVEQLAQKALGFLQKYRRYIKKIDQSGIYLNLAMACFWIKKYDQIPDYINPILNLGNNKEWPAVYVAARLLALITHYELGNYKLLQHQIESTRKFLQRQQLLGVFENALLRFLKNNQLKDLLELKRILDNSKEDSPNRAILFEFMVMSPWVDEKINTFNT